MLPAIPGSGANLLPQLTIICFQYAHTAIILFEYIETYSMSTLKRK